MRLHRFYVPEAIGDKKELCFASPELVHQLSNVFRLKSGAHVVLFDGSGRDYECSISEFMGKNSVKLSIESAISSRYMPKRRIFLCAALVKKDTFEYSAEKATELGATDIIPILAGHSEKKGLNEERLGKIVREASEQSGRGALPTIHPLVSLGEALGLLKGGYGASNIIAFHTDGETFSAENDIAGMGSIALFIGPEGGWTEKEIGLFHASGARVRCLGTQVLRAETAAIAALSQAVFRP